MNNVSIIGRLTATPELRQTQSGLSVTSFSIAVNKKDTADFFDVVAWRDTADFIVRYFEKGQQIAIEGSLGTSSYENKEGKTIKRVEIIARSVSFCGTKGEQGVKPPAEKSTTINLSDYDMSDDDLPF